MIKNLYDNKLADLVLGLFDPSRFGLPAYQGYSITDADGTGLRNYGRFMSVIANRNGEMGGMCPLFFDGATCTFEELPRPDEVDKVTKFYNRARNMKAQRLSFKAVLSTLLGEIWKRQKTYFL